MRRVEKDFDDIPTKLTDASCERKRQEALRDKNQHGFDGPYGHRDVKDKLRSIYRRKCAFCETNVEAGAPFQVEHYRPKKGVKDADHPGYYWLGYEWSNLLLACASCNNHKRTYFPIAGNRVQGHPTRPDAPGELDQARCRSLSADLRAEEPYLINPETDEDPAAHFIFRVDGRVEPETLKGRYTIDVCNLNRDPLVIERKTLYDLLFDYLLRQLVLFDKEKITADTLDHVLHDAVRGLKRRADDPGQEYTACTRTHWVDFDALFVSRFPQPDWQLWLRRAYATVADEENQD